MEPAADGPPLEKDRIDESAERADRVLARPPCQAGDVDLNGMNLTHIDAQLEVAIDALHARRADGREQRKTASPATCTAPTLGR